MRVKIALEGEPFADGRFIHPGALHCDDDRVPVRFPGGPEELVGYASKLERNGNVVSMDIELFEPYQILDLRLWDANPFVQPYYCDEDAGLNHITDARVRELTLTTNIERAVPIPEPIDKENDE